MCLSPEPPIVPPLQGAPRAVRRARSLALTRGGERWLPVTHPHRHEHRRCLCCTETMSPYALVVSHYISLLAGAMTMDRSLYADDFTQHDLFGLFPGAP